MHYFSGFSVHISRLGLESKTHPPEKFSISLHSNTCSKATVCSTESPHPPSPKKKNLEPRMFTQLANKTCTIHCNPYHCVPNRPVERVNRYTRETPLSRKPNNKKNIHSTSKRNNIGPALAIVKVRSFLLR